jgi:hypothetical protein
MPPDVLDRRLDVDPRERPVLVAPVLVAERERLAGAEPFPGDQVDRGPEHDRFEAGAADAETGALDDARGA